MKTLPHFTFLAVVALVSLTAFSPTLRAQNDAPPMDQGAPGPDDQGAPPPPDAQGAPPPDQADANGQDGSDVSFQDFYNDLDAQGNWVQTNDYGYVWQPNVQDPDWRPYSNGHWAYTDDGWAWIADDSEPWGWATYHYGRWINLDGEGWAWVPGYTWAPAWVSWRYGGGYCGWAPLPPETSIGIDFGGEGADFHIGGDCDTAYDIGPGYYNFIPVGYIGARDYRRHYLNRNNNFTIINNTRNLTSINVGRRSGARFGNVTTGGPNFATINAQSRNRMQQTTLVRSNQRGVGRLQGNQLSVFAPRVSSANAHTARPSRVSGNLATANVNRGVNINQPLAVNSRIHPAGASAQQIQAAQQTHFSGAANVATPSTQIKSTLTRPLTSLQPRTETRTRPIANNATQPGIVNHAITPAATGPATSHRDDAFTGGNEGGGNHQNHTQNSQGGVNPNTAGNPAFNHTGVQSPNNGHPHVNQFQHNTAPVQQQQVTPIQHQAVTPIEQGTEAPAQHHEATHFQHQSVAPVEQRAVTPVQHQQVAPVQHQFAAPAEHRSVTPVQHEAAHIQQHAAAPQAHPAAQAHPAPQHAAGGGGGHPAGNGKGDDQKK